MLAAMDTEAGKPAAPERETTREALTRARIYHFLELAAAHPGEDGVAWFAAPETEAQLFNSLDRLPQDASLAAARMALGAFVESLRARSFEAVESAHIGLFATNFPVVPCPPYGSLFTVEEPKRLEEMLAIKRFYHDSGVDISGDYRDLPDHLCVELEFMHLMCFREDEARDEALIEAARRTQATFIDRFMQPFLDRLAALAARFDRDNPYAHLLEATRFFIAYHRAQIALSALNFAANKGRVS
ncbi:MAG: molecular chaperone TorD family protein [Methylobacteriaceae bacterium]|nr:molecular chaperone TorD family protein [Methylobacteriaceae bacterium]